MTDLSLPPDYAPTVPEATRREINIVRLAREIAMDLRPLAQILQAHQVNPQQWEALKRQPYFTKVLSAEVEGWQSAVNTGERVKLKASAMIEEFLPELWRRMLGEKEDLLKVVKGAELVTKLAGLNAEDKNAINPSDKVVITINMGSDHKLQTVKTLPSQVIDHEPAGATPDPANELQQGLFEMSLDVHQN